MAIYFTEKNSPKPKGEGYLEPISVPENLHKAVSDNYANKGNQMMQGQLMQPPVDTARAEFDAKYGALSNNLKDALWAWQEYNKQKEMPRPEASYIDTLHARQASLPRDEWMHQNPNRPNSGYVWDYDRMQNGLGASREQVNAINDMHPAEIEDLISRGYIKTPQRDYELEMARQAELAKQAELARQYQNYSYAEPEVAPTQASAPPSEGQDYYVKDGKRYIHGVSGGPFGGKTGYYEDTPYNREYLMKNHGGLAKW